MIKLAAATNNTKKLHELRRILAPMGFEVLSLRDMGLDVRPPEDADSFSGNARIKAQAVFDRCGMMCVADDSGLCVDALGGRPGVHSARYGGPDLDDRGRVDRLLEEMKDIARESRGAKFVCAVCFILNRDTMLECQGECEGYIGFEPAGGGGFGYDPVFMTDGKSYAQLTDDEKDEISHRGRALQNLRAMLRQYIDFLD